MKLVARSADDEVLLHFCEVGGENLDSLDEVVDLDDGVVAEPGHRNLAGNQVVGV